MIVTDLETWLLDNSDKVFRMWEYRRIGDWTPYEIDKKFSDEDNLVDTHCEFIMIKESIELPDKDILIGYISTDELPFMECEERIIQYTKLSMMKLEYFKSDNEPIEDD